MADLVVIVPSRGRPAAAAELTRTFEEVCEADTELVFAVDKDDPELPGYRRLLGVVGENASMVEALNRTAVEVTARYRPRAIGFMGDDHRPHTKGWDRAYLDALAAQPGIVYGNDLFQGERLPTQCAMSTQVVRALGHMAPPVLTHLYVDNYWRDLGQAADCLTYLPDVVIEHVHPVAGKAQMDEGYRRVNAPAMYGRDSAAYGAYMRQHAARDIAAVKAAVAGVTA